MFDDRSGQLMLVSAFMLAMAVVVISLMLNNVIYASNLAYVGFMDQSRYDNLNFQQAVAGEMNYAYKQYPPSSPANIASYKNYLADYEKAVNSVTSIKGRYIDIASTAGSITDPHPLSDPHMIGAASDQELLSIYGQSSSLSYAITTGTDTLPIYHIELDDPNPGTILNNGEKALLRITVTQAGNPVDVNVVVWYDSTNGMVTDSANNLQPPGGWPTGPDGVLEVYYSDTSALGCWATIRAYVGSTQSDPKQVIVTSPAALNYHISISPPSTPTHPLTYISSIGIPMVLTAVVQDSDGNYLPGVYIKFELAGASVAEIKDSGGFTGPMMTDASGTVTAYFYDYDTTACVAEVWATDIDGGSTSNHVYISCQPPTMYGGTPVIDTTKSPMVTHSGKNYDIKIPIKFDLPLKDGNILADTITLTPANVVQVGQPYYTPETGYYTIPTTVANGNPSYTVTIGATFTASCTDPTYQSSYYKDGTLTIGIVDKNTITSATLTFP